MGIRQHDGGNLPTTVARQLSAAIGLKFIPEHMRAGTAQLGSRQMPLTQHTVLLHIRLIKVHLERKAGV